MNKKDENNNLSPQEDEYLRRLEESISGKSGDAVYKLPAKEIKKRKQLELLRRQAIEEEQKTSPPPDKEPHRIPIEWAVKDAQETETTAEVEINKPGEPVNETVRQESIPVETETPSPQIREIPKTRPAEKRQIPSAEHQLLFEIGTILRLENSTVGIYKGPIFGKEYHMIYHLRHDGLVEPQGIYIYAYCCEPLGSVPYDVLQEMQKTMRWERDRIISHLTSEEKSKLIPLLTPASIQRVEEFPRRRESLERGRLLRIRIGDRAWEAIYWGSDELGHIVAHNTHGNWTLMHLNLGRFGDSLEYGEILPPEEIRDINSSLSENIAFGD